MGITKKTKQEREQTPLATSPDVVAPVTDLRSALADINTRTAARKTVIDESNKKLSDARVARSQAKSAGKPGGSRLHGLASFSDRTKLTQNS